MIDVGERIAEVFAQGGDAPALEQHGVWYRWSDLQAVGNGVAAALEQAGLQAPGTRIGMLLRNRPALFAAALGVIRCNACIVTLNPELPSLPLAEDIEAQAPPVLLADPQDWARPEVLAVAAKIGALGLSVAFTPAGKVVLQQMSSPSMAALWRERSAGVVIEMLSSGTTGKPKRIRLERDKLNQSLWTGSLYETPDPSKVIVKPIATIHVAPLVHIGGLWSSLYNLYNGRQLALLERFEVDRWHELVLQHRPKFAALPPSALRMVLERNYPRADFETLVAIRSGTAPVDPSLIVAFRDRYGVAVLDTYGATEFAGGVAGWTMRDFRACWDAKRGSVGRANTGVELRIVDRDTFQVLAPDAAGLLEVKSEQIGSEKGWVRTADLAKIDADGFLFILGRADSVINRGGFKIAPERVQAALAEHPAIRDAAVVGIADERLGQVPVAAIELAADQVFPGADALKTFLRTRLKPYEIPVSYRVVAALPRTPSQKVSQPSVQALFDGSQR